MKKVIAIILIIIFLIGLHLTSRYFINEIYIDKYNNEQYDSGLINLLKIFNFPESYIAYYNKGNSYYQTEDYQKAIREYEQALKSVPSKRECPVRTNLSLAQLAIIDYDNPNTLADELIEVERILLENDCATIDNNGIDESSQELYNEIEELLNSNGGGGSGGSGDSNKSNNNDPNNQNDPTDQDVINKLREQQQQAAGDREEIYHNHDYEYYEGKTWLK